MLEYIVFLVMSIDFEVADEDVKKLVEDYKNELTTAHREQRKVVTKELSSEEKMSKGKIFLKN